MLQFVILRSSHIRREFLAVCRRDILEFLVICPSTRIIQIKPVQLVHEAIDFDQIKSLAIGQQTGKDSLARQAQTFPKRHRSRGYYLLMNFLVISSSKYRRMVWRREYIYSLHLIRPVAQLRRIRHITFLKWQCATRYFSRRQGKGLWRHAKKRGRGTAFQKEYSHWDIGSRIHKDAQVLCWLQWCHASLANLCWNFVLSRVLRDYNYSFLVLTTTVDKFLASRLRRRLRLLHPRTLKTECLINC